MTEERDLLYRRMHAAMRNLGADTPHAAKPDDLTGGALTVTCSGPKHGGQIMLGTIFPKLTPTEYIANGEPATTLLAAAVAQHDGEPVWPRWRFDCCGTTVEITHRALPIVRKITDAGVSQLDIASLARYLSR